MDNMVKLGKTRAEVRNGADVFAVADNALGKLYGTMDDLRLEHRRVQEKYIAMTNALISSCDVDGFRVDTPMQVPLVFYKAWVPAVRAHARSLGKKSFGIFGEFYVTPERYATMTGRGRDHAMYGTDQYIEGPRTMDGNMLDTYDEAKRRSGPNGVP
eukprot:Skav231507  [mRNA]  locus=scaffold84:161656:171987:- [translate_table: standard]